MAFKSKFKKSIMNKKGKNKHKASEYSSNASNFSKTHSGGNDFFNEDIPINRKRKMDEISKDNNWNPKKKLELFSDIYKPKTVGDLDIQKKKIEEFENFMKLATKKVLVIQGPSGWGKNSLIDAYWNDNRLQIKRLKYSKQYSLDELVDFKTKSKNMSDDFEQLIQFLEENWYKSVRGNLGSANTKKSVFKQFSQ